MTKLVPNTRLILAYDDHNIPLLWKLFNEDLLDAVKVSWPIIMRYGIKTEIAGIRSAAGHKPIIVDTKLADIPDMGLKILDLVIKSGADGIIIHGFPGKDLVMEMASQCEMNNILLYVVTSMSNHGSYDIMHSHALYIALMVKNTNYLDLESSITGVIVPYSTRGLIIATRGVIGNDLQILTPGMGYQGPIVGSAVEVGADFEIIGRTITTSHDPVNKAKECTRKLANVSRVLTNRAKNG